jgi:hypothetical protein
MVPPTLQPGCPRAFLEGLQQLIFLPLQVHLNPLSGALISASIVTPAQTTQMDRSALARDYSSLVGQGRANIRVNQSTASTCSPACSPICNLSATAQGATGGGKATVVRDWPEWNSYCTGTDAATELSWPKTIGVALPFLAAIRLRVRCNAVGTMDTIDRLTLDSVARYGRYVHRRSSGKWLREHQCLAIPAISLAVDWFRAK